MTEGDPRRFIANFVATSFARPRHQLITIFSEEFLASGGDRARDHQKRSLIAPYVAFSFAPASIEIAHVGCILTEPDRVTVGVHLVGDSIKTYRQKLETFALATGLDIIHAELVEEIQCNAAVMLAGGGSAKAAAKAALYCAWLATMLAR